MKKNNPVAPRSKDGVDKSKRNYSLLKVHIIQG